MKKSKYIFVALSLYLIAALTIAMYLFAEIHPRLLISPQMRLFIFGVFCICLYIGGRVLCKIPEVNINRVMKITFLIFFILYISLLLTFTLFDPMFGRKGAVKFILFDKALLKNYLANSFNIMPFATISLYVKSLFTKSMDISTIITNLLGNLVALTPLALFLPLLVRKCEKFKYFLLATTLMVITVELLQFALATGACDIDDLILNVSGACMVYAVLKIKPINKRLNKLIANN